MKAINIIRKCSGIVVLLFLTLTINSCTDEASPNSGEVELLSFGPAGVKHGDKISFIGNNLDKVTSIELTGATISSNNFLSISPELIEVVVPMEAAEGVVTLKTEDAAITSKTKLSFDVTVTIESFSSEVSPKSDLVIKGNFLNWVKAVTFKDEVVVTEFVSQTMTELVVKVPLEAKTGTVIISTGGTTPVAIESEADVIVTLPTLTSFDPEIVAREANLTITGTDLNWVKGVLFQGHAALITQFEKQTENEIVVKVPADAGKGKVKLVTYSLIEVQSEKNLKFIGDLPDLEPLPYAFFDDALQNGWQNWGWSSTVDFLNTEKIREGSRSAKITYQADGALYFGNGNASTTGYTQLTFSVFASPGTEGKKIDLKVNWGTTYEITLQEGKWVDVTVLLTDVGSPASITDLVFQSHGWDGIVYIDHIGLR